MDVNETLHAAIETHHSGNLQRAEQLYKEILRAEPTHFHALHYLGVVYIQLGNPGAAIEHIEKAIQVKPDDSQTYYNLGVALQGLGKWDEAAAAYRKSVEGTPDNPDAHVNLGIVYKEKGQFDEAIFHYQKALEIAPDNIAALYNLGYALQTKGLFDEAIGSFQKALRINPNLLAAYQNLGCIYQEKELFDRALEYFCKVLEIDPAFPDAYIASGTVYHATGQLDQALTHFEKAIQLKSDSANAYYGLGIVLKELGRTEEALTAFDKALTYQPDFLQARWAHCMSQLCAVYKDEPGLNEKRTLYSRELLNLAGTVSLRSPQEIEAAAEAVGSMPPFYLASHGLNDRNLQKLYGGLVCKIMASRCPEFAEDLPMPPSGRTEPLRIGFVSMFFHWHSLWKIPLGGWIENLDKTKFSIYGYHTGRKTDDYTETARHHCKRFVEGVRSFETLCQMIRSDNLHVLIYPEIGMDPVSLKLASLRLAPVQCASLGHPETSGLPTIDFYLSSDLMEPPDGDEHYTEKLIRLPNVGFSYSPFEVSEISFDGQSFGLKPDSVVYLCSHALFTHLPQYDFIYPKIAELVNNSQFIFIAHKSRSITEQFHLRLREAFKQSGLNADRHVIILPRLDQEQYHALNSLSDAFLDTVGWSANNSTFEAIDCNLPVVTLPGALMRQRHCAAILTMMGLTETIASSLDNYVELAVRLGKDPEWQEEISDKIEANKHKIYGDRTCIKALEEFFERTARDFGTNEEKAEP